MKNLISVIVPVYNVEKYLSKCINSILQQTYSFLEIILIDDGSTDQSGKICDEYLIKDERIKVVHKTNGGLSDARNKGIEIAKGEYVSFVDSDDTIDITFYETLYNLCKTYDSDISLVYFKRVYEDGSDKDYFNEIIYNKCFSSIEILEKYYDNQDGPNVTIACNKLYKKSLFNKIEFPVGKINEDEGTTYKLIFAANKIAVSNKKLYYYLQRNNSIMRKQFSEKNLDALEFIKEKSCFFKDEGLSNLYKKNQIYFLKLVIRYCHIAKKNKFSKKIIMNLKNSFFQEIDNVLKYDCISRIDKLDFLMAKLSFDLYVFKQKVCSKLHSGKQKIKLFVKKYIEKNSLLHKLFLYTKTVNLTKYVKYHNECNTIKEKLEEIHKTGKKAIIFISTPSHGNLGDHAIVYSQYKLFEELGAKGQICEVNEYLYDLYQKKIKRKVRNSDLIIIDGGGNIGTLWIAPENRILNIIMRFSKNPIVVFPQSVYFIDNAFGKNELQKLKRIFNNHPNLHFMLRDKRSYDLMNKYIDKNLYFLPDIVLYNKQIKFENVERKYIMTICRKDHESQSAGKILYIAKTLQNSLKLPLKEIDNIIEYKIYPKNRHDELFAQFETISSAKILITDRLHGMIFAFITNTPCIVFDNINKKISGVYKEWLKNSDNIYMVESMKDIDYDYINMMLTTNYEKYDNTTIIEKFDFIKHICKQLIEDKE